MYFHIKLQFQPLIRLHVVFIPQARGWTGTSARLPRPPSLCPARCPAPGTACSATGPPGPPAPRPAPVKPSRGSRWGPAPSWPTTPGKVSLHLPAAPPHRQLWKCMQMRPGYWLSHGLSSRPLLSLSECLDFTLVCMCICPYLKQSAYLSWWLFLLVCLLAWHSLFICS